MCRYIFLHLLIRGGPAEARGSGSSKTGIMVDYELPDRGAGTELGSTGKAVNPFNPESSLQPQLHTVRDL